MNQKGFTLIELILVIIILGLISSFIIGNLINSLVKGRDAKRKTDLQQVQRALEIYYEDQKSYPTFNIFTVPKLCQSEDCSPGEDKVYMQIMPDDPTSGKTYSYSSDGSYYRLYACLENKDQKLPYESINAGAFASSCTNQCYKPDGSSTNCIYGISSPNTEP